MTRPLHIVDVFAERAYAGNQLAVVLEAEGLGGEAMLEIAREMNYSETTFLTGPQSDGAFPVRIFTPGGERPFAGHPTLGTAWVIRERLAAGRPRVVTLALEIGRVPVEFAASDVGEIPWLTAPPATLGPEFPSRTIAPALGLTEADVASDLPIRLVTIGWPTLVVPLRSRDALARVRPDLAAFARLAAQGIPLHVYVFCREPHDARNHLRARFFFEAQGVREDPATGSATACLGYYLLEHGTGHAPVSLRIEQGHDIHRPSLLLLEARMDGERAEVRVGGRVIPIAEGHLL